MMQSFLAKMVQEALDETLGDSKNHIAKILDYLIAVRRHCKLSENISYFNEDDFICEITQMDQLGIGMNSVLDKYKNAFSDSETVNIAL